MPFAVVIRRLLRAMKVIVTSAIALVCPRCPRSQAPAWERAVLEALLRHPALAPNIPWQLQPPTDTNILRQSLSGKRSFQGVRSQAGAWERG